MPPRLAPTKNQPLTRPVTCILLPARVKALGIITATDSPKIAAPVAKATTDPGASKISPRANGTADDVGQQDGRRLDARCNRNEKQPGEHQGTPEHRRHVGRIDVAQPPSLRIGRYPVGKAALCGHHQEEKDGEKRHEAAIKGAPSNRPPMWCAA